MMKLPMMRLQKNQLANPSGEWRWENGQSGYIDLMPYLLAGFTKFDAMVVGAGGGKGGEVQGTVSGTLYRYYGAGGGGGNFSRMKGDLGALLGGVDPNNGHVTTRIAYGAGLAGTPGVARTPIGTSGTSTAGTAGGRSYFGYWDDDDYWTLDGFGGQGGDGATIQTGTINTLDKNGGWGGRFDDPGYPSGSFFGNVAPGNGPYNESTNFWSGYGGGGAVGKIMSGATTDFPARAGGQGAYHAILGAAYRCPGEAITATNYSGGGGGANIAPWTGGAAEYRGRGGANAAERAGVCLLRLS